MQRIMVIWLKEVVILTVRVSMHAHGVKCIDGQVYSTLEGHLKSEGYHSEPQSQQ